MDGSTWPSARARDGGIDRVPLPNTRGELWLCGKHAVGPDPSAALARVDATTIVCLNERHELEDRYPHYVEWLDDNRGDKAVWFPIHDLHAPDLEAIRPLLGELRRRLDRGERLLVHCGAGIGRAGTVATCLLMLMGESRDQALRTVADHRPTAGPEVGAQRDLIDELARLFADE
jgi:protein-tyrosine phosphatase